MIQSLIWHIRWLFDKRWRAATRCRVERERKVAETAGKPFRMTALRRFVMARIGVVTPVECTCCDTGVQDPQCGYPHKR